MENSKEHLHVRPRTALINVNYSVRPVVLLEVRLVEKMCPNGLSFWVYYPPEVKRHSPSLRILDDLRGAH